LTSEADILSTISDEKGLLIFRAIASADQTHAEILITKLNLTRKQYYSRVAALVNSGLVKRREGRYYLTAFGKLLYVAQKKIENALNNYWKLKAIDSLELSEKLSKQDYDKIISNLIENRELKRILTEQQQKVLSQSSEQS
jgi:predicted transcriptional regulator